MPAATRKNAVKTTDAPETPDPALAQFPSDLDAPEIEIAERSQDVTAPSSSEHIKVFVVQRDQAKGLNPDFAADEDMHHRNIDAMRQALINQGMRPEGDGKFVSAEDGTDDESVRLTYSIDVIPARVADPSVTYYVTEEDQHAVDEASDEAKAVEPDVRVAADKSND